MNSCDIIGYHADGEAYCEDCGADIEGADPVFADDEAGEYGATCGQCRAFYVCGEYGGEWRPHEDAGAVVWRICPACNAHVPADSAERALEAPECCRQAGTKTGDGRRIWHLHMPKGAR